MTSTTSSASTSRSTALGLLRDGCLRHGKPALLYLVLWGFLLIRLIYEGHLTPSLSTDEMLANLSLYGEALAFVFAWVASAANFHFLFDRGAAGLYAALPTNRTRLFLAALIAIVAPLAVSVLVLALLLVAFSGLAGLSLVAIGRWALLQILMLVAFCGIAVSCIQLVGRHIIGLVVYLMANFYAAIVSWGLWMLAELSLPTVISGGGISLDWASPAYAIARWLFQEGITVLPHSWGVPIAYALLGIALIPLSCLLFSRRDLEHAGDAFAYRPAHAIITVLFSLGAGVGLTLLFTGAALLSMDVAYSSSAISTTNLLLAVTLVVCSAGVCLVAETVMGRGLHALRHHVPTIVATAIISIVASVLFTTDLAGAARYVPNAEDVQSVDVDDITSASLETEASIERTTELHQALIDSQDEALYSPDNTDYHIVYLTYHMKDGTTVEREYRISTSGNPSDVQATVNEVIDRFLKDDAVIEQVISTLRDALVTHAKDAKVEVILPDDNVVINKADYPALLEALEADLRDNGAACTSYDASVTQSEYDTELWISGTFTSQDQMDQGGLTFYLSEEGTPNTSKWLSEHYVLDGE